VTDLDPEALAAFQSAMLGDDPLTAALRRHYAREDGRRHRRRTAGSALMASVRDGERRLEEMANRQRGFWPDGSPVSAEFKRQVFERWEAARDEHRQRAAGQRPVFASATADGGPSLLVRAIYGLD